MNIEEMKEQKRKLGYSYEYLMEISGVPVGTIQKIFTGVTKAPRYKTIQALEKALQKKEFTAPNYNMQKKQGEYTIDDYYALPEDVRMELIDGVLYEMTAPTTIHQLFRAKIYGQLSNFIEKKRGKCIPFTAPIDVQIEQDDKTMVQPDVLVVCNRDKIIRRCIYGAPDLIIEVLSPSTKKKDATKKLAKYTEAGVREYWMVDPDKKVVIVYHLEEDIIPMIYGFDAKVPVAIFDNECEVDFGEIYEYVNFLY